MQAKPQFFTSGPGIVTYVSSDGARHKILNIGSNGRWWLQRISGDRQYNDLDVTKIIHNHAELAKAIETRMATWKGE